MIFNVVISVIVLGAVYKIVAQEREIAKMKVVIVGLYEQLNEQLEKLENLETSNADVRAEASMDS